MTFNHIVFKNLRQNLKHYAMYLFSLFFSIVLYFSFTTLQFTKGVNNDDSMAIIKKGALVGSIFLFIIIVIFLMYANHLFVKRRTREFALFQLIGLTRQNILKMLALEQMIVFLITGVVGVLCGIAGAQLLLSIVSKLMSLSINLSIHFEPMALVLTILMLIIAYILILFQSSLFLKRRSILSMMKDSIKTDVTTAKVTTAEVISGVLGIAMIALGYYMATEMFGTFKALTMAMTSPFIILFLTVVGAYLFFRSSVSLIFKTLKKSKNGRVSITDVVFTSSIMYRMKKNAMSLTIIAIISAVTVTVLCFAALSKSNTDQTLTSMAPNEFNVVASQDAQQFESKLSQQHITFTKNYYETITVNNVKDQVITLENGSDSGRTNSILSANTKSLPNVINILLNKDLVVKGTKNETFRVTQEDKGKVYPLNLSFNSPVVEVSPEKYQQLKTQNNVHTFYGYDIKQTSQKEKAQAIAKQFGDKVITYDDMKKEVDATNGILIFVTSFLGLAFLVAAGCIIYIKQMDETEDELSNFRILKRIGFTHTDMLKGLLLKITFNFGLPLLIAILHAVFAAIAFMKLMGNISFMPVIIVIVVYTLIYIAFALIAFVHSNKLIKKTI
ncbi:TPA: peptide resistance ABC transporter permease subunit VraE [Staphylococcus aureus]|nr:peptide resistance ABC transporter permease subunit VraE [Staphylococcus aureus]HDW2801746.1 peptide resistance ABC transporter permease subunit VraE [Staphylococcus aureus]